MRSNPGYLFKSFLLYNIGLNLIKIHLGKLYLFSYFRQTYCQGGRHFYGMWQNDWRLWNFHIRSLEMDWNQNCGTGYPGFRQQPSGRPGEFPLPSILQKKTQKNINFSGMGQFLQLSNSKILSNHRVVMLKNPSNATCKGFFNMTTLWFDEIFNYFFSNVWKLLFLRRHS